MILDPFRWLMSAVFDARWIVLVDCDDSRCIRRARLRNGRWVAERFAFPFGAGIRTVELLDGGYLRNGCYVEAWEPYVPFARKLFPAPPFPSPNHEGK